MSYFAVVTFDIKNGSDEDYETVYSEFEKIGLSAIITGQKKEVKLPTTTTAGEFSGESASKLGDLIAEKTQNVFTQNNIKGEIFVSVGGNWAWRLRNP